MSEPDAIAVEIAARLAAIVDSSDDAIVGKTLGGQITSWNRAAERMFGYTAQEAIGQHITLIIPPERRFEEEDVIARISRGEKVDHFETVRRAKDGHLLHVSLTVSPIRDASQRIIGASKIARDITERKQAELERAHLLAEAEAANQAKDDFLAMFSHELRNPLAAISGATQLLSSANDLKDMERPRAVLERQVHHLRRLVDDLLDAARVRAGKVTLDRRPVNLAEAVEHALAVLHSETVPRHLLEVDVEEAGVDADPVRLEQIILNLLVNAVKYTPAGRRISISSRVENEFVALSVADEGSGIAAEALPHIFDLFVQGDKTMDRARGGLGIGLTLVQKLAELHGGTVAVTSPGPGAGSTFTVRLPRVALERPDAGSTPRRVTRQTRRVLIVEDNDDVREMLREFLRRHGHEVFEAADGAEGIKLALKLQPDVAFVDLGLPILDGYDVARHIRRQPVQPERLIALTGYGQPEDRRRCLAAGFDEHLLKPIDPDHIEDLLENLSPQKTRG